MNQTDDIKELSRELGIDYGNSDSSQDQLRRIAEQVGMNNYNSLYDNDELQNKLEQLRQQRNLNIPHYDATSSNNSDINKNSNKANNQMPNNNSNLKNNNDTLERNNSLAKNGNSFRNRANDFARNMGTKYLSKKTGLPEGITKNLLNKNRAKSPLGMLGNSIPAISAAKKLFSNKKEQNTLSDNSKEINMEFSLKLIKAVAIVTPFLFLSLCLFINLFIGANTWVNAKKLHHAYSSEKLDDYMNNHMTDEEKSAPIEDDDYEEAVRNEDAYFIDDSISNYVTVARKAERYEYADLEELKDYYSYVDQYSGEGVEEELVYKFFFKLNFINKYYKKNYQVDLDIPLLMSTLILQSDDMNIVFESNTKGFNYKSCRIKTSNGYDYSPCWDSEQSDDHPIKYALGSADDFDYTKNWENKKIRYSNSQYDIERLAQHMISYQSTETCTDSSGKVVKTNILRDDEIGTQVLSCDEGESYSVTGASYELDDEKYEEYLKEFIEKKYILDEDSDYNDDEDELVEQPSNSTPTGQHTPYTGSFYEQTDSRWKNKQLGTGRYTIGQAGCFVTSLVNQINRSGTVVKYSPLTPVEGSKYFTSGSMLVQSYSTKVAPNFIYIGKKSISKKEKLIKYLSGLPDNEYVIIGVSVTTRGTEHYVALNYVDSANGKIYIMDPSMKKKELYESGLYQPFGVYVWKKTD